VETHFPIHNLGDLEKVIDEGFTYLDRAPWWRGHADVSWKLLPSIYRKDYNEKNLIFQFMSKAKTRHPSHPPDGDDGAWLFFMQHYRLPTRLLDWTNSLLVALYFALDPNEQHAKKPAVLWALSPYKLNAYQLKGVEPSLLSIQDCRVKSSAMPFQTDGKICAVSVPEMDIRMLVQQGACTIHGNKTPIEDLADCNQFLRKYEIPAESKARLRQVLSSLGVRESWVFPDLEHLAKEISDGDINF
jgi:hypothetical protein